MKKNKLFRSLLRMPLLALLIVPLACSNDDEPNVQTQQTDEFQAPIHAGQEDGEVYKFVEQMPAYQGGEAEMYRFLGENIRYPEKAKEAGVEGMVVYSFVVEKDGSVSDIKVVKSLSPETDQEALRVIKMTNKAWEPGLQGGEPVRVEYTLPIRFALK